MKQHILWVFAIAAILSISCDPATEDSGADVTTDKTLLEFPYSGGELTLGIKATTSWSISAANAEWCKVSPSSGSGDATVTVSADPNPDKLEGRSAKLVIKYGTTFSMVDVSQEKNSEDPVFSISTRSIDISAAGGEFEITIISDSAEYEITIVEGWIKEVSRSGNRKTGQTIKFKADVNEDTSPRTGIVSVCTKDDTGTCIPVMINQAAGSSKRYVRTNIGFRFTATWCGYCPYMDEAFHTAAADASLHFDFLTFHASAGYPLYLSDGAALSKRYNVQGFPTGIINGWSVVNNYTDISYTVSKMAESIGMFESTFPCVAGVSVSSSAGDGKVDVRAIVEATPGPYLITAFLLESGIVQAQTFYPTTGGSQTLNDFEHDNVARKLISSNLNGDSFTIEEESAVFDWSATVSSSWVTDNLSVAVLVFRPYGSLAAEKAKKGYPDNYIVNAVIAPVGTTKEMQYAN